MNALSVCDLEQPQSVSFYALPLFDNRLRNAPDCASKKCCKKYKKGKRCKSCPNR